MYIRVVSKRALKKYLSESPKEALEAQVIDLYERFPQVKEFYDFAFNPKEDKLLQEAKFKISNEYFPVRRKRPRARRSVAQKYLRQFRTLGMAPYLVADLMLYNIETAQLFAREKKVPEAFYKSMLNSFTEATGFISQQGLIPEFKARIVTVYAEIRERQWPLLEGFNKALDILDLE